MNHRFAVFNEESKPRIYKVPVHQPARLVNQYPDRKVEIFETLGGAKQAALALIDTIKSNARPKFAKFSIQPEPEDDELRRSLSELSEDRVENFYF
jgi:hypothetical protein